MGGYDQSLTVISMEMSDGAGAAAAAGAASGAPSVSLKTTESESSCSASATTTTTPAARTLGSNQVMLSQYLDTKTGDTYWSQYIGAVTGPAGESVTLNDIAPAANRGTWRPSRSSATAKVTDASVRRLAPVRVGPGRALDEARGRHQRGATP